MRDKVGCLANLERHPLPGVRVLRRRWFQIFAGGLVLLYLLEKTLLATQSLNYVPSVLLLGAFLVPVTFVTYLYERLPQWEVPLPPLAVCFFWGGALGTVVAGSLEYDLLGSLGVLALLGIGLIEESAKLIFPLIFYFLGRYRSEGAGIVLGVSTAMGFAALAAREPNPRAPTRSAPRRPRLRIRPRQRRTTRPARGASVAAARPCGHR